MQDRYDPKSIEQKWQSHWAERGLFRAGSRDGAAKYYVLAMLPYPSGEMHMGHARVYAITDVIARVARKRGFDVLHPFGWDSFGLPAENAAINEGVHPAVRTPRNVATFKDDVVRLGISVDWTREFATSSPEYYRWNQWFFLRMLERGIVYRRVAKVNFCPSCNTVLANEQVEDGRCWRCNSLVEERQIPEWAFRITAYADQLLDGMQGLDWPERILSMQRNWIGRSDGLELDFAVVSPGKGSDGAETGSKFRVFTTRADTVHGVTAVLVAPDHPLLQTLAPEGKKAELQAFAARVRAAAKAQGEGAAQAEKKGIDTGLRARNPFTGQDVPVWAANFVLAGYGTGAVMSVPAHDQRDLEFARAFGLPVREVIQPVSTRPAKGQSQAPAEAQGEAEAFTDRGVLVDSGEFTGMPSEDARQAIAAAAEQRGVGKRAVNYHLRDWGFSRQRYWGTPIPIVYCEQCDPEHKGIPVPDSALPITLPDIDVREVLTGKGEPPLAKVPAWIQTTCPRCGGPARREAETMDTFVDSAWYWARYLSPHDETAPFSRRDADRWLPIDVYVGGPEHAVMHLLYFRFWTRVMAELGLCGIQEPARKLITQGIVKGRDGEKMSKSKGNGISPRELLARYGADTARLFMMFAAPVEKDMDWSDEQVEGQYRFLGRLWRLFGGALPKLQGAGSAADATGAALDLRRRVHRTREKVGQQFERLHFNTAIASLMELSNAVADFQPTDAAGQGALREALETLAHLLSPLAPHVAEELWALLGHRAASPEEELARMPFPAADPALVVLDTYNIAVQVNGKLRGEVQVPATAAEDDLRAAAAGDEKVSAWLQGKTIRKVVVIPRRLVNFVVT